VTVVTSPNAPASAELSDNTLSDNTLSDNTHVTTTDPILSGQSHIPAGVNGTVITEMGGAAAEVLFGPPVNATETVSDSLLAVA